MLAAFDESDWLVMLATLDVPSVKNLRLALETMELLHFPKSRLRVVVNRADSKVGLRLPDVEKLLSSPVDTTIPSSRSVPLSVNKGSPIMLEEPKGPVAESIRRVAAQLTDREATGRAKQSSAGRCSPDPRSCPMSSLHERIARARTAGVLPQSAPRERRSTSSTGPGPTPWPSCARRSTGRWSRRSAPAVRLRDVDRAAPDQGPRCSSGPSRRRRRRSPGTSAGGWSKIADDVLGFGPIEPFLRDPTVTEIMVNSPDVIYVEREGRIFPADGRFVDETHLRGVIDEMVGQVGRRIDEKLPYVDARLPDGSRINAVISPLCVNGGPYLTVRKFTPTPTRPTTWSPSAPCPPRWPSSCPGSAAA